MTSAPTPRPARSFEPWSYALLRAGFGLTMATHGWPKLLGLPHGSMTDPMAGTVRLIETTLGLPFAPQIGVLVGLLEGIGGLLLVAGLATRLLGLAFTFQMMGICLAIGPTYPWIDRGIEYPLILALVALTITARGSGILSADREIARRFAQSPVA